MTSNRLKRSVPLVAIVAAIVTLFALLPATPPAEAVGGYSKASRPLMNRYQSLGEGINVSSKLEQGGPGVGYLLSADYVAIKAVGFDHVRIPVDFAMTGRRNGNTVKGWFWNRVNQQIGYALNAGLIVILDFHEDPTRNTRLVNFNAQGSTVLTELWTDIANRAKSYDPNKVFFELYNEPILGGAGQHKYWNTASQNTITAIRDTGGNNSKRPLIVGSVNHNTPTRLESLDKKAYWNSNESSAFPDGDRNIILTAHYYGKDPGPEIDFTHYGIGGRDAGNGIWRRNATTLTAIEDLVHSAKLAGTLLGRPVYIGEFGANMGYAGELQPQQASRERWAKAVREHLEDKGDWITVPKATGQSSVGFQEKSMTWAWWEYSRGFALRRDGAAANGPWQQKMLSNLKVS